jgi:hypothetical protein
MTKGRPPTHCYKVGTFWKRKKEEGWEPPGDSPDSEPELPQNLIFLTSKEEWAKILSEGIPLPMDSPISLWENARQISDDGEILIF